MNMRTTRLFITRVPNQCQGWFTKNLACRPLVSSFPPYTTADKILGMNVKKNLSKVSSLGEIFTYPTTYLPIISNKGHVT